jgi:hypothetical protein
VVLSDEALLGGCAGTAAVQDHEPIPAEVAAG